MRSYIVELAQNLGNGVLGATLDISSRCVEVGPWSFETEKELTRITPSEVTVRIADVEGEIWSWIQTQIQSAGGLLPPWLTVDVDGARAFTGIISPSEMAHTPKTGKVNLTAADWSSMLGKKTLGAENAEDDLDPELNPWLRSPKTNLHKEGETKSVWLRYLKSHMINPSYWTFGLYPSAGDYPTTEVQNPDQIGFPLQINNWLIVGDLVTCAALPGKIYKVIKLFANTPWTFLENGSYSDYGYTVQLSAGFERDFANAVGFPSNQVSRDTPDSRWNFDLTRLKRESEPIGYYSVVVAVGNDSKNPCYKLELNSVDGIVTGDQLRLISNIHAATWTVLQVDPAGLAVITREEIRDVAIGDRVFFTNDSIQELPMEDARVVLARAVAPQFSVNLDRLQMPELPSPTLVWLPLRPSEGSDLLPIRNVVARLSNLRVYGSGTVAWDGTPEDGWLLADDSILFADWTTQRESSPSSLMPDDSGTLTPDQPPGFVSVDLKWRSWPSLVLENGRWHWSIPSAWNPATAVSPTSLLVHDYLQMRRIKITGSSVVINTWTGSAWGADATMTWPTATALSVAPFVGASANDLLAITTDGIRRVALPSGEISVGHALDPVHGDARVVTTAWGTYLVSSKGYASVIRLNATDLNINWVRLIPEDGGTLFPQTFAALDATTIVVLARLDTLDQDGKTITETHLLRIPAEPGMPLASEKVLEGAPITLGALRDPSQTGRVIGHCGGRLFQVSKQLPLAYALERFKPTGMTAGELIEHVCQVLHAVAVPDATGTLHIVSRTLTETPIELAVSNMNVNETRAWEHFYSYVRVSGSDSEIYADVPEAGEATTLGGGLLEISGHPLIWTQSGCEAMARALHTWFSTPRRVQTQTWVWWDVDSPAPWESLPPLARVKLNHLPTVWLVLALEDDKLRGTANVTLLEVG